MTPAGDFDGAAVDGDRFRHASAPHACGPADRARTESPVARPHDLVGDQLAGGERRGDAEPFVARGEIQALDRRRRVRSAEACPA